MKKKLLFLILFMSVMSVYSSLDIDGVTCNIKTKEFSYTKKALERGTDKYIQARMETEKGARGIMRMVKSRKTFKLHVTDKPMFIQENVDGVVKYTQIICVVTKNNIYMSTYSFYNKVESNDYSNSLLVNFHDGSSSNISINSEDVIPKMEERHDDYYDAYVKSGLKKFEDTPGTEYRTINQFIHGMGAHEERHLFHCKLMRYSRDERNAMKRERIERKQYIKKYN